MMNKKLSVTIKQLGKKSLLILLMTGFMLLLSSCTDTGSKEQSAAKLKEDWGIEITRVHITANGYMVDFRYRVIDPQKAKEIFDRQKKPYLIDQASGKVMDVPNFGKVGPLRNSNMPKEGKIYWMFFNNMSGLIKPGSLVTIVIGDFRVEDLIVT